MYELRVEGELAAAHHLLGYPGDCARPHGHNWLVEVYVRARELNEIGLAVDFKQIKKALKAVIEEWDHKDLNVLETFQNLNPTAENMSKALYDRMSAQFNDDRVWIHRVTIWENARCSATYFKEEQ